MFSSEPRLCLGVFSQDLLCLVVHGFLCVCVCVCACVCVQARAHIDIKGGLSTCPFSSLRESALFFVCFIYFFIFYFFINEYMYICVRVCFCLRTAFPVKQIKISGRVRKWDSEVEFRIFRCLSPLCVSPQARAAQQCSTHWSAHAHHRQAENRRSEALPPSPVVFVLVWRWVVINKRLSLEFTANYPKDKRQIY